MKMTTYTIKRLNNRFQLEHRDGPYKIGLETIPLAGEPWLDEAGLAGALTTRRVPQARQAPVMQDLRSQQIVDVTFDAKTNEPLPL